MSLHFGTGSFLSPHLSLAVPYLTVFLTTTIFSCSLSTPTSPSPSFLISIFPPHLHTATMSSIKPPPPSRPAFNPTEAAPEPRPALNDARRPTMEEAMDTVLGEGPLRLWRHGTVRTSTRAEFHGTHRRSRHGFLGPASAATTRRPALTRVAETKPAAFSSSAVPTAEVQLRTELCQTRVLPSDGQGARSSVEAGGVPGAASEPVSGRRARRQAGAGVVLAHNRLASVLEGPSGASQSVGNARGSDSNRAGGNGVETLQEYVDRVSIEPCSSAVFPHLVSVGEARSNNMALPRTTATPTPETQSNSMPVPSASQVLATVARTIGQSNTRTVCNPQNLAILQNLAAGALQAGLTSYFDALRDLLMIVIYGNQTVVRFAAAQGDVLDTIIYDLLTHPELVCIRGWSHRNVEILARAFGTTLAASTMRRAKRVDQLLPSAGPLRAVIDAFVTGVATSATHSQSDSSLVDTHYALWSIHAIRTSPVPPTSYPRTDVRIPSPVRQIHPGGRRLSLTIPVYRARDALIEYLPVRPGTWTERLQVRASGETRRLISGPASAGAVATPPRPVSEAVPPNAEQRAAAASEDNHSTDESTLATTRIADQPRERSQLGVAEPVEHSGSGRLRRRSTVRMRARAASAVSAIGLGEVHRLPGRVLRGVRDVFGRRSRVDPAA